MPPSTQDYINRLADTTIGNTTLRNQGSHGVIRAARNYLKQLELSKFSGGDYPRFEAELDLQTERLRDYFPEQAKHWGTARKALNLFLGEIYYHRVLCRDFGFESIAGFLEVPLDSVVAK